MSAQWERDLWAAWRRIWGSDPDAPIPPARPVIERLEAPSILTADGRARLVLCPFACRKMLHLHAVAAPAVTGPDCSPPWNGPGGEARRGYRVVEAGPAHAGLIQWLRRRRPGGVGGPKTWPFRTRRAHFVARLPEPHRSTLAAWCDAAPTGPLDSRDETRTRK